MAGPHPGFTLTQLIEATTQALKEAKKPAADAVMQFAGCELDLAVTVGGEGEAGIKFWLVNASAKAKAETTSRVKLTFGPLSENTAVYLARPGRGKGTPIKGA